LPGVEVMDAPYEFYEQLEALEKVLTDNTVTTVRLVTNPEKMVIKESLRAHAYLSLYNVATDMVVANRIIPDAKCKTHFLKNGKSQQKYKQGNPCMIFILCQLRKSRSTQKKCVA
jgi:arsenite-transporting ATPase